MRVVLTEAEIIFFFKGKDDLRDVSAATSSGGGGKVGDLNASAPRVRLGGAGGWRAWRDAALQQVSAASQRLDSVFSAAGHLTTMGLM